MSYSKGPSVTSNLTQEILKNNSNLSTEVRHSLLTSPISLTKEKHNISTTYLVSGVRRGGRLESNNTGGKQACGVVMMEEEEEEEGVRVSVSKVDIRVTTVPRTVTFARTKIT